MSPDHNAGTLWLRAILLVAAGLLWNGLLSQAHARCGGLPVHTAGQGDHAETRGHGDRSQVPLPGPQLPRCHGPNCTDAPLPPAAPIVVSGPRGSDGLAIASASLPTADGLDRIAIVDQPTVRPLPVGGIFRPPRG